MTTKEDLKKLTKKELIDLIFVQKEALKNTQTKNTETGSVLVRSSEAIRQLNKKVTLIKQMHDALLDKQSIFIEGYNETQILSKFSKRADIFREFLHDYSDKV